jgi:hypothetical protein
VHLYACNRTARTTITVNIGDWPFETTELSKQCLVAVTVGIDRAKDAHLEDLGLQLTKQTLQPEN